MKHTHPLEGDTEAYIKYPLAHELELMEPLPAPVGQKAFARNQSFKVGDYWFLFPCITSNVPIFQMRIQKTFLN